jgi:AraC-like DNA-binding protein
MYSETVIDPATLPHLDYEASPQPVVALAIDYPNGSVIPPHRHRRAQLLYATEGVMLVHSDTGRWVVPPARGVWLASGVVHSVRTSGQVRMRSVFVAPDTALTLPAASGVLNISPLLRALILAAVDIDPGVAPTARDERLMLLLLDEIRATPTLPLHLPWPSDRRLQRVCEHLSRHPGDSATIVQWAARLGISVKTFHRLFRRETQLTFGRWRQQARLLLALEKLAHGDKIVAVALEHGYTSQSAFSAMFKRQFGVTPSEFCRG